MTYYFQIKILFTVTSESNLFYKDNQFMNENKIVVMHKSMRILTVETKKHQEILDGF